MQLEIIILSEGSQTENNKEDVIAYMWNLKKKIIIQMHLLINKQTHRHRQQTYSYQREGGRDQLGVWH